MSLVYIMLTFWRLSQPASAPTWEISDWLDHYTTTHHTHQASVSVLWSGHKHGGLHALVTVETLPHLQEIVQYEPGLLSGVFLKLQSD